MTDVQRFARIVEDAVFSSLLCAQREPEREGFWRAHADKLESKFATQYGRHYSYYTQQSAGEQ